MPDDDEAKHKTENRDEPATVRVADSTPIASRQPQPQIAGEEDNTSNTSQKPSKLKFPALDVITAISTAVMAFAAIGTWRVASNTQDIERAITQISKLADASQQQVEAAHKQFRELARQADAAQQTATATQGQLQEIHQEQRPIIQVESVIVKSPLSFHVYGARIALEYELKNLGRSTALYASANASFYVRTDNKVLAKQRNSCAQAPKNSVSGEPIGFTIFPGVGKIPFTYLLSITDLEEWIRGWNDPAQPAIPMLVGCIDYVWEGIHHQTGFIYEIDRLDQNSAIGIGAINPLGGDIPAAQVQMDIPPWFVSDVN